MKKIISFILVFTLVLSCAGLTFSQATDAPLSNSAIAEETTAVTAYKTLSAAAVSTDEEEPVTDEPTTDEPTTEEPTEPEDPGEISFFQGIIVALKAAFSYISNAWKNLDNNGGTGAFMDAVFDALKETGLDVDGFYNWFLSSGVLQWFAQIFLK